MIGLDAALPTADMPDMSPQPVSAGMVDSRVSKRWWSLAYTLGLLWGAFYAWLGATLPVGSPTFVAAAMATTVIAFASVDYHTGPARLRIATLLCLQAPCIAAILLWQTDAYIVALLMLVWLGYQALRAQRIARDYQHRLATELALVQSRAEAHRLSKEDALTGLSNRRELDIALQTHWAHAMGKESDLALIVFDIDGLQSINNRYGHSAADAALRHIACLIRNQFRRSSDICARTSGDEFTILLADTTASEAMQLATTLSTHIRNSALLWEGNAISLSVSMGVDGVRWDMDLQAHDTLRRVQHACHQAKTQGRNRVVQG